MVTFSGAGANISVKGGTGSVTLGSGGDFCVTAAESISMGMPNTSSSFPPFKTASGVPCAAILPSCIRTTRSL